MVPYTGGTPQIINDMMGKLSKPQANRLSAFGKFCWRKGVASG
jgi:hypothetical protein